MSKPLNRGIPVSKEDPRLKRNKKKNKKPNHGIPMSPEDPRNVKDYKRAMAKRKVLEELRKPETGVTFNASDFQGTDRPFTISEIVYQAWMEKKPEAIRQLVPTKNMSNIHKQFLVWVKQYFEKYNKLPSPLRIQRRPDFALCIPDKSIVDNNLPIAPVEELIETFYRHARHHLLTWAFDNEMSEARLDGREFDFVKFGGYNEIANSYNTSVASNSLIEVDMIEAYGTMSGSSYHFGLDRIDKNTGGIFPGELCYIVGRPENGKTMVGLHLVYQWFKQGARVGIVSGEMTKQQVLQRIHAFSGGFNSLLIRTAPDNDTKHRLYQRAKQGLVKDGKNGGDIIFCDGVKHDVASIAHFCARERVDILLADALYLMAGGNDWKENKALSNGTKLLARGQNIPVIATLQLKRGNGNSDADVDLEDIAYSDSYGQDADFVIAVEKTEKVSNVVFNLSMVKNRQGGSLGLSAFSLNKADFSMHEEKVGFGGTST